jgi:erythromycin esterase-like protein
MKKLKKFTIEPLKMKMPVWEEAEERGVVGGRGSMLPGTQISGQSYNLIPIKRYWGLLALLLLSWVSCSQRKIDCNFAFSKTDLPDFVWHIEVRPCMYIDSSEIVAGKYPLCLEQDTGSSPGFPYRPSFQQKLYQQIYLPPNTFHTSDSVRISVNNKCYNLSEAQLKVFCLNEVDDVVYQDSIDINNDSCWITKSLLFHVLKTNKIRLGIHALGYDYPSPKTLEPQKLWLDRVTVSINGKNVEDFNYRPANHKGIKLEKQAIVNLAPEDESSFHKLKIPENKTIIGIGESVHGSKTLNRIEMNILKTLIENNRCKLVLFELGMDELLTWNLFVQGRTPDDFIEKIREYSDHSLFSSDVLCDFFLWLRNYNKTTSDKVAVQGIEQFVYRSGGTPLFDYLYAFYNRHTAIETGPLLRPIMRGGVSPVLDKVSRSLKMKEILGEPEYSAFLHVLKQGARVDTARQNGSFDKRASRDYAMFINAEKFMSLYQKEGETVAIVAHSSHLDKKGAFLSFPHVYSLGYYLNEKYKEKYYALSLLVGNGSISSFSFEERIFKKNDIALPVSGSLEELCMKQGAASCFFYPAEFLPDTELYYRSIGSMYYEWWSYNYGSVKNRIDGFIFTGKSRAKHEHDTERSNDMQLLIKRMIDHLDILKEIE